VGDDGDESLEIDGRRGAGSVDLVGEKRRRFSPAMGRRVLARRALRKDLAPHAALPEDTRLWAALQLASGGTWAGCVYDPERIRAALKSRATRAHRAG